MPVLAALGLVGCLIYGIDFWTTGQALVERGKPVKGTVTRVTGSGNRHHVTYEYKVNGMLFSNSDGSGQISYFEGDPVEVRYLPNEPSKSHFDPERLRTRGQLLVLISPPFFIFCGWLWWWTERRLMARR